MHEFRDGLHVCVEHGVLVGEVRGLEVCRVVDDPHLGTTRLEVGVGAHDREAFQMLHGDVPAIELLATDVGRAWRYGAGEPEMIVEGSASDLFLRLMSRPGVVLPRAWEQAVDALGSPADG